MASPEATANYTFLSKQNGIGPIIATFDKYRGPNDFSPFNSDGLIAKVDPQRTVALLPEHRNLVMVLASSTDPVVYGLHFAVDNTHRREAIHLGYLAVAWESDSEFGPQDQSPTNQIQFTRLEESTLIDWMEKVRSFFLDQSKIASNRSQSGRSAIVRNSAFCSSSAKRRF